MLLWYVGTAGSSCRGRSAKNEVELLPFLFAVSGVGQTEPSRSGELEKYTAGETGD